MYSKVIQQKTFDSLFSKLPLINEKKVGICSKISDDISDINIFCTDYFAGLLTANLAVQDIQEYRSGVPVTLSRAKDRLLFQGHFGQYRLVEFDDYSKGCSHHLGVDVLAITSDFCLPLMIQAEHTQVSQGLLAPTGSGSVDWTDQLGRCRLKEVLRVAGERELKEEATRQRGKPDAWKIENIVPIGYFRMPHRAGKPQFAYLAKLGNHSKEMGPNREVTSAANSSRDSTCFKVETFDELKDRVAELIRSGHNQYAFSVPLWGSLVCLHHAITRNPAYVSAAVGFLKPRSL